MPKYLSKNMQQNLKYRERHKSKKRMLYIYTQNNCCKIVKGLYDRQLLK